MPEEKFARYDSADYLKTEEDIEKAFAAGASMVTIGSIAVTNPDLFMEWID